MAAGRPPAPRPFALATAHYSRREGSTRAASMAPSSPRLCVAAGHSIDQRLLNASVTLVGVMGNWSSRAPVAAQMALATTAPMVMIAGSPPPCGAAFLSSTKYVSICGSHEKRGI